MSKSCMKENILEKNEKISMRCSYSALCVIISAFDSNIIHMKMYTLLNKY